MAKKKKEESRVKSLGTYLKEQIKIAKLKMKISDRKQTNAAFARMRKGKATAADSARLAQAKALPKRKR